MRGEREREKERERERDFVRGLRMCVALLYDNVEWRVLKLERVIYKEKK
jgi:hypothetical protein